VNLNSVYSEIKQFLSISDENFDLENVVNSCLNTEPAENKLEIVGDILSFINKFSMFQDIKPFMGSLYKCIKNTLEIKPDSIYDFDELLIKNAIMHFVQEHTNYSKFTQKDQVSSFLADSLEKLETQPLIMNLGLLIKPMYQDQKYLTNLTSVKEVEVDYNLINDTEVQIKSEIDNWFKTQNITLDNQEELKVKLIVEFNQLISRFNLAPNSEKSKKLFMEIMEMLSMKLTMLSLMEQVPDDSFKPIPIKHL
jgi:ribosome-associated toxin RatA of RatAB toxin-antitoxin module